MKQKHLSDGTYVTINKDFIGQIILTANDHRPEYATDVIHLDPMALETLTRLVKEEMEE